MNTTAPRIVLDTNILIASIGRMSPFRWIFDSLIAGKLILCVSNDILFEYHEVLEKKTTSEIAENITNFITINPYTERVDIYFNFNLITADESDNKFVDCAISSNADYLVSNDKHFQILNTIDFPRISVLTLAEFSDRHGLH